MPCSGLKSATSFTSGAPCSRSIVVAPSRARPVWFVTRPTRLPLSAAKPLARSTSRPRSTGRARRAAPAAAARRRNRDRSTHSCRAGGTAGGQRRGRHRRDARAQRRHVALAVRVDAVREEDHVEAGRRIHPQRRPGEAGVAERAERQQLAAVGRERRVHVPAERSHVALLAGVAGVVIFATASGDRMRAPR